MEPDTPYRHNWHIDAIADHLQAVSRGEIRKLIINVPPGHMKSLSVCVFWPTWEWIDQPHLRYLFASYAGSLSTRDSMKCRDLIFSPWYQQRWGERYRLTKWHEEKLMNTAQGFRIASSVGGLGTGERVHRVINDDLLRANDAHSEAFRKQAISHMEAMSTRGVNPATFTQVLIMQRLHEADPAGWALEQGGWDYLMLPAEYEPARRCTTSIGFSDPRTEPGELLWPEHFPAETISDIKKALGSYGAAAQLQQNPTPSEGGIFKRAWWKWYDHDDMPKKFDEIIQSWDCSFKDTDTSDYVAGQVWGRVGADKYLLDRMRKRMDFPATVTAIREMTAKWPKATLKLIEDAANGVAVIQVLKHEIAGIVAVSPQGGKEARAHAVSPEVEAGNVYLPKKTIAPWIGDYVEELSVFPNGAHDDEVDSTTQALLRFATKQPARTVKFTHMGR